MKLRVVLGSIVATFVVGIFFMSPASATSGVRQLAITPLRSEYTIPAGTTQKGTITLKNTGAEALDVTLDAEAFKVVNQNYDYSFQPNSTLGTWVGFSSDEFNLVPNTSKNIEYSLNVPIDAEPGGKYLSLFASSVPSDDSSAIVPVERVGSLLYLTIPGGTTQTGKLLSLNSPSVIFGNSSWNATIQNSGTNHFRSTYSETLSDIFGHKLTTTTDSRLILPQTIRLVSGGISTPQWIGVYKVNYDFSLGDSPDTTQTKWLVNLPPLQLAALVVILLIIALLITKTLKKIMRHSKKKKAS